MFLYEALSLDQALMWVVVLIGLILLNEITRRYKWGGIFFFIILPIILTIAVWPKTAGEGTSMNDWFHWAKVYSCLAGCVGFMALRYIKGADKNKYVLMFPPLILAINILEACIRDFEVFTMNANGMVDGVFMISGPWNAMNGIAGLLNIVTICGWTGIFASKEKSKDMLWPDMLWFWIIAYDLWNYAYTYNCLSNHSFYCGAALLISCTIPAFVLRKGAWLQHRAHTLGLGCMFAMCFPSFIDTSRFAVESSHSETALFVVSFIALAANIAVFVYQFYRIITRRLNPLKDELYTDLKGYREVNALRPAA